MIDSKVALLIGLACCSLLFFICLSCVWDQRRHLHLLIVRTHLAPQSVLHSQTHSSVVGEDVLDAILSFFDSGSLLREVNNTIIAKVPKIPNATKLSNYRLISCCNTISTYRSSTVKID